RTLSIAVLPFVDMSTSKDQQQLADGLTEELIQGFAGNENLSVTARTSVFQYKGLDKDIRRIGKELGVSSVIEGSVRKEADRVWITVQFIDATDGFHLWSHTFKYDAAHKPVEIQRMATGRV